MNTKPTRPAIDAWIVLMRTQRALLERVEADLKQAALPPLAWYDVLLELHRAPDGRLRQYEIGQRILLSKHNLSRLLDRLAAQGLIRREACEADRRGADVAILAPGEALLKKMWPVYGAAIETHFAARFSASEIRHLRELMNKIPR